jgi:cystathionine beta-lyase
MMNGATDQHDRLAIATSVEVGKADTGDISKNYELSTEIVFVDSPSTGGNRDQYLSFSPPIYQTAIFKELTVFSPGDYEYTRSTNPTRSAFDTLLLIYPVQ